MKWGFLAVLAALVVAAPATAAPPAVHARAWLVQSGTTGEVLAQHGDRARIPIASITKLMTVLVTLE
ncbi:MAG: D-alanyl-D-alanine carboxypeptidase, partial [Gaiellaceae bacterium]|nr:D-alanyl-D-alanine carboxypeptidase [Gaiellaceae bacterium]